MMSGTARPGALHPGRVKLVVQIPCLNEEETLAATVRDIPRQIEGIDRVEILIIDDGCTDQTVEVARQCGVEHVLSFSGNRGLGQAFSAGLERALALGADVIVNTDGDNQYCGHDIAKLVQPILAGRADIVVGDRQTDTIAHFSWLKRRLEKLGSRVVSRLAGVDIPDVASGFRAYSREAALKLTSSADFDHTVDHAIQAGRRRFAIRSVPIRTNDKLRESRLSSNLFVFVLRSLAIMVRVYSSYAAMRVLSACGLLSASCGVLIGLRFLYIFFFRPETRDLHVQSLILAAILLIAGVQMILTGVVADLVNSSRTLLEDVYYRVRRLEFDARPRRGPDDPADQAPPPAP